MKKYILSVAFLFAVLIAPVAQVQAAGLKSDQVSAIVALLQSFGVDQSVINTIQTTLNGGAATQQSQPTVASAGSVASVASPVTSSNLVTSVSNSGLAGSFTTNGTAVNNLPVYTRISSAGVNMKGSLPKGCIQPAGASGCFSDLGYRDFLPSEWPDNSTIQTVMQDTSAYPLTTYELYIKFPGGSPIKAGTLQLIAPTSAVKAETIAPSAAGNSSSNTTTTTSTVAGCAPGALFSATTGQACSGATTTTTTTPAAVTLPAIHLTSISLSSLIVETVGTTATIYGSGFTGTNSIYMNGIQIDPATINSSGGLTPTWISFVVPSNLSGCFDRLCSLGAALTSGTYSVSVQNTNGTSNSIGLSVYVFGNGGSNGGDGAPGPAGVGSGGGTGGSGGVSGGPGGGY